MNFGLNAGVVQAGKRVIVAAYYGENIRETRRGNTKIVARE
jgi:hypothetical protein